ncbi:MAG: ABC transporter substrate-binding protein [Roseburia sp.]|nr:ABC transporter substrate-binding protein [Roseburia sp.]MCM1279077.1 ABC transporter substrate-binding protein [Robinsoniella sp.]
MKIRVLLNSIFLIFFVVCLSGCAVQETVKLRDENKEGIFQSESLDIDWKMERGKDSVNIGVGLIAAGSGKTVLHTEAVEKNDYSVYKQKICIIDGKENHMEEVPYAFGDDRCILLAVDENGLITMLLKDKKDDASATYTLTRIDDNGNKINSIDISQQMEAVIGMDLLFKMVPDKAGNVYFLGGTLKGYCFNEEDNKIVEIDENIQILDMAKNKDGEMIFAVYDKDLNIVIKTGNPIDGRLNDIVRLPNEDGQNISELFQSNVYDFCYGNKKAIYGYAGKEKKFYKILDFEKSNINSEKLSQVCEISAHTFIGSSTDTKSTDRLSEAVVLSEAAGQEERMTLKMGGIDFPPIIKTAVSKYNQTNQEFRIDMLDYSSYENPEAKINAEIMAGQGFDLLCLNGLCVEDYTEKSLLEDLYAYMESDQIIAKTDFIEQVLKVMEHNGKLYYMTPGFGISTAVGRASLLKEGGSMGFQKVEEIVSEQTEERGIRVFYKETKEGMLRHLCREIDRNFGVMSHEELKKWLEAVKQLPTGTEETSLLEAVKNKEFILITDVCLEFNDILLYERMFGEEAVFIGYPFQGGNGNELSSMGMNMGICSGSTHKEAAWEFIKILLSEEFQYYVCYPNCFPVRKDCMERVIRMVSATEEYTDQDGNNVRPYRCEMTYDDVEVVIEAMNEEEKNKFWDLVNSIKYEETWNRNIWSIVNEEADKYFLGEKSLEKVVDSMEERLKLYFEEMN